MMWSEACPRCRGGLLRASAPGVTRDDLLHLAIRLVREGQEDGPDFVSEVVTVFEALKRDVEGLTYLIESRRRLERAAGSLAGDGGTTLGGYVRCRGWSVAARDGSRRGLLTGIENKGRRLEMVWMKTCPRCRGDLALDHDLDGPFIGCIQCGAVLSKGEEQSLLRSPGVWRKQAIPQPAT